MIFRIGKAQSTHASCIQPMYCLLPPLCRDTGERHGYTVAFVGVWRCVAPKISDMDEIDVLSKSTSIVPWYDLYDYYPLTRCLDLRKGKFTRAGKEREYPQSTAKLYGQFVLQIGGWCL